MYSSLPVKCLNWTEKNLRYAFVFFPLVGFVCGAAAAAVWKVCVFLKTGSFLFGVLAFLSVVVITGGIHLDGFCDTADALFSRRPAEEKLRIMKDPNCGPFAVFSVIFVVAVSAASYSQLYQSCSIRVMGLLTGGMMLSRCMSAFSVTVFRCAPSSSLARTFGENAGKPVGRILAAEALVISAAVIFIYGAAGAAEVVLSVLVFFKYYFMQKKEFGGVTGDLAGFFLVSCETVWLLAAALAGGVLL